MDASLVIVCLLIVALAVVIAYIVERDLYDAHPEMVQRGMMFAIITSFGIAVSVAVAVLGGLMQVMA